MIKKSLAILLAALMLLTSLSAGAAVSAKKSEYCTGTVLAAINTNYDDLTQSFSARLERPYANGEAAGAHIINGHGDAEEGLLCGGDDTELEPLSPAEAARKEATLGVNADQAKAIEYHVGDRKTVHSSFRKEFPSDNVEVECVYVGEYCTVWNEVDGGFSLSSSLKLGKDFDEIVVREFEIFGDKRIDTDGDGKTALFVHNLDSSYGGYFSVSDLVDSLGRIGKVWFRYKGNGNACDCVHLDGAYVSTVVHEFQHYLQRCWQFYGKNNLTYVPNELESYINEGFSECASYLLVGSNSRVWWFEDVIADPEKYSLVNWSFDSAAYAASYVFCQYLRTSYAQLPGVEDGAEIYKLIMETRANKWVKNTLSIAADLLYPTSLYPDLKNSDSRCRQLIVDFWLAVLCKDGEGRRGFGGETWADPIEAWVQAELPEDGSTGIRSAMAAYYYMYENTPDGIADGTAYITKAGKDMVFVGVSDIGHKVTYNWNNGLWKNDAHMLLGDTDTAIAPDRFCPGKTFLGWSKDPNASTVTYNEGDAVPLAGNKDISLYAVWEDATEITSGQSVRIYNFRNNRCLRFTPGQAGYYNLYRELGIDAVLCSEGETVEPECTEWTASAPGSSGGRCENSYYLEAGKPYDIYAIRYSYVLGNTLSINYASEYYILRYDANLEAATDYVHEIHGRTDYTLETIDYEIASIALAQGLEFAGWATAPNAATAQFMPGEKITLTEDTAVYGVWLPITKLTTDTPVTLDFSIYRDGRALSVTPETGGTYLLSTAVPFNKNIEVSSWLTVYDENGNDLILCCLDLPSMELSLQAGKTYILRISISDDISAQFEAEFSLEKISDKPSARIIFDIRKTESYAPYFVLSDRFVYTVPKLTPAKTDGSVFAGWAADNGNTYAAGDKIEPITDLVLSPQWLSSETSSRQIKALRYVVQMIRLYIQCFGLALKGNAEFIKTLNG
ncbi:MAG: InlB B-repeat-containing protein [Clostridiales bacterium]|nr:InlB B-repeat-containing protein [Clostridiales bacterium]